MDSLYAAEALRIECLQQLECFRTAHFTDADAIGTAQQRGTRRSAIRDWRPLGETTKGGTILGRFEVHIVRLFKQNLKTPSR